MESAFRSYLTKLNKSENTISGYTSDINNFSKWFTETTGETFALTAITQLDIAEFKKYLNLRGFKPATVNRYLSSINNYLSWAEEKEIISYNPAKDIKKIEELRIAPKALIAREKAALARAFKEKENKRDTAVFALFIHAGLRVTELCSLMKRNVSTSERKGMVVNGKGEKVRHIPLNSTARKMIKPWLEEHPGGDWLFPGGKNSCDTSKPIARRAVKDIISKYTYLARLEEVTPHTLRHTFAKDLIDSGISLDRVAYLLGHSKLDTTAIYTKPTGEDLEKDVENISWN